MNQDMTAGLIVPNRQHNTVTSHKVTAMHKWNTTQCLAQSHAHKTVTQNCQTMVSQTVQTVYVHFDWHADLTVQVRYGKDLEPHDSAKEG